MTHLRTRYNRASRLIFGVNYNRLSTQEEKDLVESVLFGKKGHQFGVIEKKYIEHGGKVPKGAVFYWLERKRKLKAVA